MGLVSGSVLCLKISILLMLLLVIGLLSYQTSKQNSFRDYEKDILYESDKKGSVFHMESVCNSIKRWIIVFHESKWSENTRYTSRQYEAFCRELPKSAKELRTAIKKVNEREETSIGLLVFAVIFMIISLIIQIVSGPTYSRRCSKCLDFVLLVHGMFLVLSVGCLLLSLSVNSCKDLDGKVSSLETNIKLVERQKERLYFEREEDKRRERNNRRYKRDITLEYTDGEATATLILYRSQTDRLHNCQKDYEALLWGVNTGIVFAAFIMYIVCMSLASLMKPPPEPEEEFPEDDLQYQEQVDDGYYDPYYGQGMQQQHLYESQQQYPPAGDPQAYDGSYPQHPPQYQPQYGNPGPQPAYDNNPQHYPPQYQQH